MRININLITYNNGYGLTVDAMLLKEFLIKNYGNRVNIKMCNFYDHSIPDSHINIFFEIIPSLLTYRSNVNIFVPNQEWFYKHWKIYLKHIDIVLAKTKYTQRIFGEFTDTEYVGWDSKDHYRNKYEKDYNKFIHICGKSIYKQTEKIISNWEIDFPELLIIYNSKKLDDKNWKKQENIKYINHNVDEEDLVRMMNNYGVHICCSEAEGFGHYINEARSCKSIVITTNGEPMKEFVKNEKQLVNISKKVKLKKTFGSKFIIDENSFKNVIRGIMNMSEEEKIIIGEENRELYLSNKNIFNVCLKNLFDRILKSNDLSNYNFKVKYDGLANEHLPNLSIVTITHNRRNFFKLCLLNIYQMNYPKDKIEWIIIDDSNESMEKIIPDDKRFKYFYTSEKLSIGRKRNLGVEYSSNEWIAFMDDDDYYPPDSFRRRIERLIINNKKCVYCTSIGCFHINKFISIMNVPPHQLSYEERISEATLAFRKQFWREKKFKDDSMGSEGKEFMIDRYDDSLELKPDDIIVSLLHSKNTSHKDVILDKPNGCHFNFSDKLFSFIVGLDEDNMKLNTM